MKRIITFKNKYKNQGIDLNDTISFKETKELMFGFVKRKKKEFTS